METLLTNYDQIKDEVKKLYAELLTVSKENEFLKEMNKQTIESLNGLCISDEEKAKALIAIHTSNTEQTISKTFEQALLIIDKATKLPKEVLELDARVSLLATQKQEVEQSITDRTTKLPKEIEEMDAKIDLLQEQKSEVNQAVLDRQAKRQPEVNILTKQELLTQEQINKLKKDIEYVESQKNAMLDQVIDNRTIKAMDSIGETIGTLGNGGIRVPQKLFEVYLEQNQILTGISKAGDTTITKL